MQKPGCVYQRNSNGTSNPHNVIRATMKALSNQTSPKQISIIRNKKIAEIIEKRG